MIMAFSLQGTQDWRTSADDLLGCACIFSAGNLILNAKKIITGKKNGIAGSRWEWSCWTRKQKLI
jgi:hypothetical protein